jgi:hypothetical protein
MPTQKIPGMDLQYSMIMFDAQGKERTDDPEGGTFSKSVLEKAKKDCPTDVFLFSHGWKGDIPGAIEQYDRWIGAMWKLEADRAAMGSDFKPLFIGLHWPSLPWGEETGPQAAAPVSFGVGDGPGGGPDISDLVDSAVEHFGGGDTVRKPLEVIFSAFADDPAAQTVPADAVKAYHELGKVIGFSSNGTAGTAPDEDGAPLDPQAAADAQAQIETAPSFGIFDTIKSGILSGLRQTSFWLMKHRARTIGEQGMHQFLAQLQNACNARIHLMGHSFGCVVMSSILGGPGGKSALPRPVDTAALVQGALSLWSFADQIPDGTTPGYFQAVLGGRVSGAIVTTQSSNDAAVGLAYPAAVAVVNEVEFGAGDNLPKFGGVGTFGIQGTKIAESRMMLDSSADYGFRPGRVYNIDGSAFIPGHSGIDGPQVAHMLWQAALPAKTGQGV